MSFWSLYICSFIEWFLFFRSGTRWHRYIEAYLWNREAEKWRPASSIEKLGRSVQISDWCCSQIGHPCCSRSFRRRIRFIFERPWIALRRKEGRAWTAETSQNEPNCYVSRDTFSIRVLYKIKWRTNECFFSESQVFIGNSSSTYRIYYRCKILHFFVFKNFPNILKFSHYAPAFVW